ncbi:MAG: DUF1674 domain-containing protein [Xanthobacteraceae bacterium]
MPTDPQQPQSAPPKSPASLAADGPGEEKPALTPAAERALAEAAARRADGLAKTDAPQEISGRGGLDPARYGDWEINGLAADF